VTAMAGHHHHRCHRDRRVPVLRRGRPGRAQQRRAIRVPLATGVLESPPDTAVMSPERKHSDNPRIANPDNENDRGCRRAWAVLRSSSKAATGCSAPSHNGLTIRGRR
jgi:hypothetical protein